MAKLLDLSHPIREGMPVYPCCLPPEIRQSATVEADGYAEKHLSIHTHTGTHIDAPAHMLAGAPTLDRLGLESFVGDACVIDVAGQTRIERAFLESQMPLMDGCAFVLFHTGWDRHWGSPAYFEGFPVLTLEAAEWLAARGLKGVGWDAISVDPVGVTEFPNHLALFRAGVISIENLTGLEPLIGQRFLFSCLPLKLENADGCPVRAMAIVE